ncbi:MAG: DNA sulfur modification protein DndE [Methylobacter sp.]|nr:MAG: DNA sulfur modification protein DndE [Methylobacter sp.]
MTPIENIRLSEKAKTQLITMKRRTGIANWNVLCRWAFCLSINQPTRPPEEIIPTDSSVEMTWKTFTGGADDVYWGMLLVRAEEDTIPQKKEALTHYFRLHLHRGISYLTGANGPTDLSQFVSLALKKSAVSSELLTEESNPADR